MKVISLKRPRDLAAKARKLHAEEGGHVQGVRAGLCQMCEPARKYLKHNSTRYALGANGLRYRRQQMMGRVDQGYVVPIGSRTSFPRTCRHPRFDFEM